MYRYFLISLEVWPVQAIAASGGYQRDPMCLLGDDMWVRLSCMPVYL